MSSTKEMQLCKRLWVCLPASPHASTSTFMFASRMAQLAAKRHAMPQQPDLLAAENRYSEADIEAQLCMLFPAEMR